MLFLLICVVVSAVLFGLGVWCMRREATGTQIKAGQTGTFHPDTSTWTVEDEAKFCRDYPELLRLEEMVNEGWKPPFDNGPY